MAAARPVVTPADTVLSLRGVTKRFRSVVAVDAVDLEIRQGEFLTLLGPSGSGKSTLLMLIAGFEEPDHGDILLGGQSLLGVPPHLRRIGVVFQNYALFPHLSVFENVAYALRSQRWPQADIAARVQEMLALVRLEGLDARAPSQLSGGQQQRVALARALAFRPSLLLLDEPLGALDKRLREHMLGEFRRIHRALGTTMVFVTHDQEEALAMSDRIAVLDGGRLIRLGAPRELYERPGHSFVVSFLGDANLLEGTAGPPGRVLLGDGWEISAAHTLPAGQPVRVAIRPEKLWPGSVAPGLNAARGIVEDVLYLGATVKYRVACGGGQVLIAAQATRHGIPEPESGAEITLLWHPEDGRVLADG